jgi:hypothetical protein
MQPKLYSPQFLRFRAGQWETLEKERILQQNESMFEKISPKEA